MILTCPKCATRYLVDEGEMRPKGRTVKCASCGEEWRVSAAGENETPAPHPTPVFESVAPATEAAAQEVEVAGQAPAPEPNAEAAASPPVLESLFVSPINTDSKPAPAKGSGVLSNLLLGVVMLAILAAAAFAFRMEIVRIAPTTAPLYAAVGISVNAPPPLARPAPQAAPPPHG